MDHLGIVNGELIRVRPEAAPVIRRRLVVVGQTGGADRYPVKVTGLHSEGCVISGLQSIAEVHGKLWLKLPGFEAFQVAALAEEDGKMLCWFAQPLQPAMVQAVINPRSLGGSHSSFRPRCTFI